ncbi:hypothetical protein CUR86_10975 [Salinicola acroporae]|uniref:Uncharacterized protein n=1 Tax=Salinicola acroporae TaxID=1541440 RepID=A0ABT6I6B0_9GAMM|nr:hypothetical protein [Salinicola acroporae]
MVIVSRVVAIAAGRRRCSGGQRSLGGQQLQAALVVLQRMALELTIAQRFQALAGRLEIGGARIGRHRQ